MKILRRILLVIVLIFALVSVQSAHAAVFMFYYDTNRIVVESKFNYQVQSYSNNVTYNEETKVFSFPSANNNNSRNYTITFRVFGVSGHQLYFGVHKKNQSANINSITGTGGNKGTVTASQNYVDKVVTVNIRNRNAQSVMLDIVHLIQSEYNSSVNTFTGFEGETYTLI